MRFLLVQTFVSHWYSMRPHATKGFAENRVEGKIYRAMSPEKEPRPAVATPGSGLTVPDATGGGAVPGPASNRRVTYPSERGALLLACCQVSQQGCWVTRKNHSRSNLICK